MKLTASDYAADDGSSRSRLGIVGGGFAGLYAAQLAASRWPHLQIELFEQENRPGGRAVPQKLADGQLVDAAPLRFHGVLMKRAHRLLQAFEQPIVPWPFNLEQASNSLPMMLEEHLKADPFPADACAELLQFRSLTSLPLELALQAAAAFPERDPRDWWRPKNGFFALAEQVANQCASYPSCRLHYGAPVERVEADDRGGIIVSAGRVLHFDAIILAMPPVRAAAIFKPAQRLLQSIGSLAKTRIWLATEPSAARSFHIIPELMCRLYFFERYAMAYADQDAALALYESCQRDPEGLALKFCSLVPGTSLLPRVLGFRHWPDGVQFRTGAVDPSFGSRLVIANEAFSEVHGFVEGALCSAERALEHVSVALSAKRLTVVPAWSPTAPDLP